MPGVATTRRSVGSVALAILCVACTGGPTASPTLAATPAAVRDGYVDAGGGVQLYYRVVGTGRDTVLVLHGGPGYNFRYLADDLEPLAANHVLLFYDQRGSGQSTIVTDSAQLDGQRFAEDVEAVRRHFGLGRMTLLAHSWGAGVAVLYASRYAGNIGRLLIVDPIPLTRPQFTQAIQRFNARRDSVSLRRLQELRVARAANPGDVALCREYYSLWFPEAFADRSAMRRMRGDFCGGPVEGLANKIRSVDRFTYASLGEWDWRPMLHAVTVPVLIMHGTEDFIPVESARDWAAVFPNARLLLLEHSGHFPYVEEPERFFPAADAFLHGQWPQ